MNLKQSVRKLSKYQPPLDGRRNFDGLRLDFNERTIGPGPKLTEALVNLGKLDIGIYPEYDGILEQMITDYLKIEKDQICLFNGSDLALSHIFRTVLSPNDKLILPSPSFPMFDQYGALCEAEIIRPIYSGAKLAFPEAEFYAQLRKGARLAVICNPNNPTGGWVEADLIEKWVREFPQTYFMVDEAYAEFSGISVANLTAELPNLIVTRTFSKAFGLAGVRIGYSITNKELAETLRKVTSPYEVNVYAYELAKAALADLDYVNTYIREVMDKAKPAVEAFFTAHNITFYPSVANYVLFKPDNADELEKIMKTKGFLLRAQNKPGLEGTIRLTIGSNEQMTKFLEVYKEYIG